MIVPCGNPVCKAPTERADLIAGLCGRCFGAGAPVQLGPLEQLTERTLQRQGRGKTPLPQKEGAMPPTTVCRYCDKVMPAGSLHRHEHVMCKKRPGAATVPESPTPKAQTPTGARTPLTLAKIRPRLKRAKAKALGKLEEPTHKADGTPWDAHCERAACPYRGLSTHIARVRVQELVRGGLGIEDAARFVREHCA